MNEEFPDFPTTGTAAAENYFRAACGDTKLFHFITSTVVQGDYVRFIASQALAGNKRPGGLDEIQLAKKDPGPLTKFLQTNSQLLIEMHLARLVDSFQTYLVDLVRTVLQLKPKC